MDKHENTSVDKSQNSTNPNNNHDRGHEHGDSKSASDLGDKSSLNDKDSKDNKDSKDKDKNKDTDKSSKDKTRGKSKGGSKEENKSKAQNKDLSKVLKQIAKESIKEKLEENDAYRKTKEGVDKAKNTYNKVKNFNKKTKFAQRGAKAGLVAMMFKQAVGMLNSMVNAVLSMVANIMAVFQAVGGAVAGAVGAVTSFVAGMFSSTIHLAATLAVIGVVAVTGSTVLLDKKLVDDGGCNVEANSNSSMIGDNIGGVAANNWTTVGTTAYNNAKTVWDYWKAKGFSGAAIAGIVANAAHEGGFDIADRAEGYHGSTSENSGISKGIEPKASGSGYSVGGGGIYQFTPYTKFAPLGDSKWLDINAQNDYVWNNEVSKYMNNCPYGNGKGGVGSYKSYAHLNDPATAAKAWFAMFERGAKFSDTRSFDATKAYELFGGKDVVADDTLLGSSNSNADINSGIASALDKAQCADNDDIADGTGSISESSASGVIHWGRDSVPEDVKQYIHNPQDAGLGLGNATGWFNGTGEAADQCVGFASSYFYAIWSGLSQVYVDAGKNATKQWAEKNGGSVSTTPKAGAIASCDGGVSGISSDGPYGHTWIVLHVLQNGDTIIAEQNMTGLSGAGNKEKNTWNFGWISAQKSKDAGITYYVPEGKTLSWTKK